MDTLHQIIFLVPIVLYQIMKWAIVIEGAVLITAGICLFDHRPALLKDRLKRIKIAVPLLLLGTLFLVFGSEFLSTKAFLVSYP